MVEVNGIKIHVAEKGQGPAVLFIHGFPELWYSWRHQIVGLASLGYRALAPDLRGFGDSDIPTSPTSYTLLHIVGDLVALLDALSLEQVFVVGHDWGAIVAWNLCLWRPDRVKALVNMSVCYRPRNPAMKPMDIFRTLIGEDYYVCRFQEPGEAESELGRLDCATIIKNFMSYREPVPFMVPKGGLAALAKDIPLPSWLSEDDVSYYATKFEKTGFTGGLNYYRNIDRNWELSAPWTGAQVTVPVKFIVGDLDLTYSTLGAKEYIHNGGFKETVPLLDEVVVMEGVGHFINQEKPEEITAHIYDFIKNF